MTATPTPPLARRPRERASLATDPTLRGEGSSHPFEPADRAPRRIAQETSVHHARPGLFLLILWGRCFENLIFGPRRCICPALRDRLGAATSVAASRSWPARDRRCGPRSLHRKIKRRRWSPERIAARQGFLGQVS